ncbi:MAG TPA: ATP-binding protein [Archangium sp.]|uniref:ATP-binding protein n=1 Tax=Archangium sp. TaxID=1872627 RepID=UPI002E3189C1|nr:ATP-binding protein [Archangium sp.]HEX5749470.1 ATP-binding protein [Archangium sp.]
MPRCFNTDGPCHAATHYLLPPLRRLPEVHRLIEQQCFWVLHSPRLVGKTTVLRALAAELTASNCYAALYVSFNEGAVAGDDFAEVQRAILSRIHHGARLHLPAELCPPPFPKAPESTLLDSALSSWARTCPRPLVLFFDEIDALSGLSLLSVLRQLRAGFPDRPVAFPSSVVLCGLHEMRDYKVTSGAQDRMSAASFFNITAESLTLRNFTRDEVAELYQQHTDDTGQMFLPEAIDRAFYWTQGQPWLVNALWWSSWYPTGVKRSQPLMWTLPRTFSSSARAPTFITSLSTCESRVCVASLI